jgi:hypothetical protein
VNGYGTATDYNTGLVWEQKTNDASVHDLPKGTDLTLHSQAALNRIAHRLNTRPPRPWATGRQRLCWQQRCDDRLNPRRLSTIRSFVRAICPTSQPPAFASDSRGERLWRTLGRVG